MSLDLESTATLLNRIRSGDDAARERLCRIYLPLLTQWAHGRLPVFARDMSETDDLVQSSLISALNKLDSFKPMHEGAFLAYLRKILLNNIRLEIRKQTNNMDKTQFKDHNEAQNGQSSQLEMAVGHELVEKYEMALTQMDQTSRQAVILRVEFGYTFSEVSVAMNLSSANAARMKISRALLKLARKMS